MASDSTLPSSFALVKIASLFLFVAIDLAIPEAWAN